MYVALEGIDALGKSTQIEFLKGVIKDAIFVKEPHDEILRSLLLQKELDEISKMFLFLADRALLFSRFKMQDALLISDRSYLSHIAYAKDLLPRRPLINMNAVATKGVKLDAVILFLADEELLSKRLSGKKQDLIESKGVQFLLAVQKELESLIAELKIPCLKLDAARSKIDLHEEILTFLRSINAIN